MFTTHVRARITVLVASALFTVAGAGAEPTLPTSAASISDVPARASRNQQVETPSPAIRIVPGLEEPLIAMGTTTRRENAELDAAIAAFGRPETAALDFPEKAAPFLEFLQQHPRTPWRVAVLTNLGIGYYHAGYFSRALASWDAAWTLGRSADEPKVKALVDRAAGELGRMHARIGQASALESLFADTKSRSFSGPASELMTGAHEGAWMMKNDYGTAFLCGPQALKNMMLAQGKGVAQVAFLDEVKSGPRGFSLQQVSELAARAGFEYQMIHREPGQLVPVPSVINWKLNHYAAIVGEENGRFHVIDPTFGGDLFVTQAAIDAESSGYFLVSADRPQQMGWREASAREARNVFGMGFTSQNQPGATTPDDQTLNDTPPPSPTSPMCPAPGAPGTGMCGANAHTMTVSLNLNDTPVGYWPQKGPPMFVRLTYNQREAGQPANFSFFNVGAKWTISVLSYIQDNVAFAGTNVTRYVAGGGLITYPVPGTGSYNSVTGQFPPEKQSQAVLVRIPATGALSSYELRQPDGSKQVFAQADGALTGVRRVFLTQIVDPAGNTLVLNYDVQLRLTSITDATNRNMTFAYEDSARPLAVTKVTDPFGRSAALSYDANGRLISITDIIGLTSSFAYDAAGLINAMTTPYGTSRFAYGENPGDNTRFLEMTDPLGYTERVEFRHLAPAIPYNEAAAPTGMTGQNIYLYYRNTFHWNKHTYPITHTDYTRARVTHWLHNSIGQTSPLIESSKKPLEGRVWYNYGNVSSIAEGATGMPTTVGRVMDDGTSQIVRVAYNALGSPTQVTDPMGRITYFDYATNNIDVIRVRQQTSASTNTPIMTVAYNAQHQPLASTDAAGQTTVFTYNAAGQRLSATDPLGHTRSYTYDGFGRLTSVTNANGNVEQALTYDGRDRVATTTDSEGHLVSYEYDLFDRVTAVRYPDGTANRYTYDKLDLASTTDRLGRTTTYSYDANRQITSVRDPLGRVVRYSYFENGELKTLTDAKGNVTRWDVDLQGRPATKTYADGRQETFVYEPLAGRVKSMTDALGQTKSLVYFNDDKLKTVSYNAAVNATAAVNFAYDAFFSRMISMADGIGTTTFQYYPLGVVGAMKLASEDGPYANDTVGYQYDAADRVIARSVDSSTESFAYDALDRMSSHDGPLGTVAMTYLGQTVQPTGVALSSGAVGTHIGYESNVNDRRLRTVGNGAVARTFQYAINAVSQITSIGESVNGIAGQGWTYTYDAADRLKTALPLNGVLHSYDYDDTDNITSILNAAGPRASTYNAVNEVVTSNNVPFSYDANGNLLDDGQRAYRWDAENRLVGISYRAAPTQGTAFRYDGMGRRLAIINTTGATSSETRYLWCGDSLCQARSSTDVVTRRYYDEGEVVPTGGTLLFYGRDQLGSVRDVLTAQSGAKVASYDYDSYGNVIAATGRVNTDFRFAGMFFHPQSGLYLTNFRAYDPKTGSWLSRDPIGEQGGLNLHGYASRNPIVRSDPRGLADGNACYTNTVAICSAIGAGFGAAAAGTAVALPSGGTLSGPAAWEGAIIGGGFGAGIGHGIGSLICAPSISMPRSSSSRETCSDHQTACLLTDLADEEGNWGHSRCAECNDACMQNGGFWPSSVETTSGSNRCDYWNYRSQ